MLFPNANDFEHASQSSKGSDSFLADSLSQVNQRVGQSVLRHGWTSLTSTADIGKLVEGRSSKTFSFRHLGLHVNNSVAVLFGKIFSDVRLLFWPAIHFIEVDLVEDTFKDVSLKVFAI